MLIFHFSHITFANDLKVSKMGLYAVHRQMFPSRMSVKFKRYRLCIDQYFFFIIQLTFNIIHFSFACSFQVRIHLHHHTSGTVTTLK